MKLKILNIKAIMDAVKRAQKFAYCPDDETIERMKKRNEKGNKCPVQ